MADLPIAPGQIYIEVEYDYEYKAKDRLISIRQGECYMLVRKTNEDWWQVRKEEGAKAFYVPAQYVREARKALMPPPKPLMPLMPLMPPGPTPGHQGGSAARVKPSSLELRRRSSENLDRPAGEWPSSGQAHPVSPSPVSPSPVSPSPVSPSPVSPSPSASSGFPTPPVPRRHPPDGHSPGSPTDHERALAEILLQGCGVPGGGAPPHPSRCNTLPRARARSPERLQRGPLDVDSAQCCDSEGSERRTNDSESGDELSSSSTEHLQTVSPGQGRSDSPVYTNLQELKISRSGRPPPPSGSPLHALGDWETHRDASGRHFYYNRCTQERTWKPPRARDASMGSSRGELHQGSGEPEWIKHVDEQGRPYYYSADGSRSEWELPKYNHSPPQPGGDGSKSLSLDSRKQVDSIVLTKWRHSTYSLEPSDKDYPLSPKPGSPDSDSSEPSSPNHPTSPSEKCGVLNVTKITEQGKKVRKNWTSSWTVLHGSSLLFAKGQGGGTSWFGGQSQPEFTVDLRGGSVEWASKDKSSKKNVIELKTRQGTELLIQSENDSVINEWYRALLDTISTYAWESDEAIEEDMPESPGTEKQDREKDHRDSKKNRAMKSSSSVDAPDNKKTRHKLKKFLTRRPTLQSVRDRGYIKDQVFGCSLSCLCQRENTSVPGFVRMSIEHVESNGLSVDGLYRVSGNLAVIQKLRFAVNHDEKVDLEDSKWEDIHVTTGALKMFFRELPEPLFTYGLFHHFVSAIKIPDYRHRVQSIKDLVRQLPKPNLDTMQGLFKHLRRVIDHGEENRMTTQSVAIVFGPTLLRPETETWNMAVHMVYQNQIVELILLEYEGIFGR